MSWREIPYTGGCDFIYFRLVRTNLQLIQPPLRANDPATPNKRTTIGVQSVWHNQGRIGTAQSFNISIKFFITYLEFFRFAMLHASDERGKTPGCVLFVFIQENWTKSRRGFLL
jgi:hypothetical protein